MYSSIKDVSGQLKKHILAESRPNDSIFKNGNYLIFFKKPKKINNRQMLGRVSERIEDLGIGEFRPAK